MTAGAAGRPGEKQPPAPDGHRKREKHAHTRIRRTPGCSEVGHAASHVHETQVGQRHPSSGDDLRGRCGGGKRSSRPHERQIRQHLWRQLGKSRPRRSHRRGFFKVHASELCLLDCNVEGGEVGATGGNVQSIPGTSHFGSPIGELCVERRKVGRRTANLPSGSKRDSQIGKPDTAHRLPQQIDGLHLCPLALLHLARERKESTQLFFLCPCTHSDRRVLRFILGNCPNKLPAA
mmetsp:Transcript_108745/g.347073  ORF Transcript_108745/g.347073 Transcript_108745/m.347073 type:complete len:234 (+) Transcript_108745:69-770(+)